LQGQGRPIGDQPAFVPLSRSVPRVEERRPSTYIDAMRCFAPFDRFRLHGSSLMSRLLPSERFAR